MLLIDCIYTHIFIVSVVTVCLAETSDAAQITWFRNGRQVNLIMYLSVKIPVSVVSVYNMAGN